jgi:hypothetical protein
VLSWILFLLTQKNDQRNDTNQGRTTDEASLSLQLSNVKDHFPTIVS